MDEGDHPVDAAARRAVDELGPGRREAFERACEVVDLEAEVMHRRAPALSEEASDPGARVRRLEELDPGGALGREHDADSLIRDVVLGSDRVPERVAIEGDRVGK